MDETRNTIGLSELLNEVDRDLDELRRKHASDYGVKNITMWWELERERLVTRHDPAAVVMLMRRVRGLKRVVWFILGCASMLALTLANRLLIR